MGLGEPSADQFTFNKETLMLSTESTTHPCQKFQCSTPIFQVSSLLLAYWVSFAVVWWSCTPEIPNYIKGKHNLVPPHDARRIMPLLVRPPLRTLLREGLNTPGLGPLTGCATLTFSTGVLSPLSIYTRLVNSTGGSHRWPVVFCWIRAINFVACSKSGAFEGYLSITPSHLLNE